MDDKDLVCQRDLSHGPHDKNAKFCFECGRQLEAIEIVNRRFQDAIVVARTIATDSKMDAKVLKELACRAVSVAPNA